MSAVNVSFEKLLEYAQRAAAGTDDRTELPSRGKGDWAGLAFRLGQNRLVCGFDRIIESLQIPQVTRVPGTKPFVLGLANVRGDLMTVVDLGCFLFGSRTAPTPRARMLAASLRGRPVGLVVDEVYGQRNFVTGDATNPELAEDSPLAGLVLKLHRSGSETWQEFDLDTLFGAAEFLDGAAA